VAGGQYPELRCDPPILGTTVDLEITYGMPNWPGALLASLGPPVRCCCGPVVARTSISTR